MLIFHLININTLNLQYDIAALTNDLKDRLHDLVDESVKFIHEGFQHGSVSMRCIQIG